MTTETIGFIGVGSQGGPMAHRIIDAGMPLVVWARRPEVLVPYKDKSATIAGSVSELGSQCNHVGICVVNDADVLQICDELIPAMRSGGRVAIHSTILPETCVELERRCDQRKIGLVDAPVSGGAPSAEAGTLTVMCGARKEAFEAALPVFETFGKLIVLLGPAGAGQQAKLVNNALLAANMAMADHALAASESLGIDKAAIVDLLNASSGRSFGLEVRARLPQLEAFHHGGALLVKDLKLLRTVLPQDRGAKGLWDGSERFRQACSDEPGIS